MKLVIFDLDQTLVDLISVHDAAIQELFKSYFGVDASLREIDFAGRSLTENMAELARLKGIVHSEFTEKSKFLIERYEKIFQAKIPPTASNYILPGVKSLLDELSKTSNFVVLYTGDSPGVTQRILEATGLDKYFKFSVYGTEAKSRADMARLAIKKAEQLTGARFKGKDVVIVGDSVHDVECGKQLNALTIAVATGFHSDEELLSKKPDYLFENLENYWKVLNVIEDLPDHSMAPRLSSQHRESKRNSGGNV
jgi:phosphoglycolate phosphatase-like HAD superfamily hydrolase